MVYKRFYGVQSVIRKGLGVIDVDRESRVLRARELPVEQSHYNFSGFSLKIRTRNTQQIMKLLNVANLEPQISGSRRFGSCYLPGCTLRLSQIVTYLFISGVNTKDMLCHCLEQNDRHSPPTEIRVQGHNLNHQLLFLI